jgi:hypothetical protein
MRKVPAWVLIVAAVVFVAGSAGGLLAVIWAEWYVHYHTGTSIEVLQFREDVAHHDLILERNLRLVSVPRAFGPAFRKALKRGDEPLVLGRRAPRRFYGGEILFAPDFIGEFGQTVDVRQGFELVDLPVDPKRSPVAQLCPGAVVSVYGDLAGEGDGPLRTEWVLRNVRLATVDGSPVCRINVVRATCARVGVIIRVEDAVAMREIEKRLAASGFSLGIAAEPVGDQKYLPEINKEIIPPRPESGVKETGN